MEAEFRSQDSSLAGKCPDPCPVHSCSRAASVESLLNNAVAPAAGRWVWQSECVTSWWLGHDGVSENQTETQSLLAWVLWPLVFPPLLSKCHAQVFEHKGVGVSICRKCWSMFLSGYPHFSANLSYVLWESWDLRLAEMSFYCTVISNYKPSMILGSFPSSCSWVQYVNF